MVVAFTTFGNIEDARHIGTELVKRQCVACVNLLPHAESIYQWKGEIHSDPEVVAIIKTTREQLDALKAAIVELSSYECPELIVMNVQDGLPAYLDWVFKSVK